ncbi:rhodopsin, long-wavelength [Chanos chanos]|uniref:Rhodopsin, long-wavelength n=1 Tax=Chanos chanos TaxID=29144 RepID=A0A6J2UXW3_CHACN|nr:rhodopsin, long-wavelength-like [Chanos chanos]
MDAEDWIESIIRALMCLIGIIGNNWLGFSSLPKSKSQLKTNDVLFINLALSNLITNYLVDLPDTMADFADRWFLGELYCGIFRFCADLSETSSIFSTLFISIFWYQKLVGSLKRGGAPVRLDNLRLVAALLGGSWMVAIVFSVPHFFFATVKSENESSEDCLDLYPSALAMQAYETTYLTLANAVPIAGIVFASLQIVVTLLKNQKRIKNHSTEVNGGAPKVPGAETKNTAGTETRSNPSSGNQVRAAKSVVAVASVFLVCWLTHLLLRITSSVKKSSLVVEIASYIAASYTCIIPYIFLHGVKKLSCSCKR